MANLNQEHFSPNGKDLASRTSARLLRIQVELYVSTGKLAVIDLTNVISISESYADELFAVLVEDYGLEWFSKNIKILNHPINSTGVLRSIATAIRRRLENQAKFDIKASVNDLIAVKKSNSSSSCGYNH